MKSLALDLENCNCLIPDARRRILASEARKFADNNIAARTRWPKRLLWYDRIITAHERLYWEDVFYNRKERNRRKEQHEKISAIV